MHTINLTQASTVQQTWQEELANSVINPLVLLKILNISANKINVINLKSFPMRVPPSFISRMQPGNPDDPLLRQVLSTHLEQVNEPGYSSDPLSEQEAMKIPGLLHKYNGRLLLILSAACAINCRYCFRRHFPYSTNIFNTKNLINYVAYIRKHEEIKEIILSGGDPLILKDETLDHIIQELAKISHVKYLRIHSRMPIMIPQRITSKLINILTKSRFQTTIVLHSNHPQEIDTKVANYLKLLHKEPITVLNQSVLLKNINDSAKVLVELSHKLFEAGVLPYYLHLLDPVAGAAHFYVTKTKAEIIMEEVKAMLPGFLVPKLAQEIPGAKSKIT